MRKVLKRRTFTSSEDLKAKVLAFIDYYQRTLAKPFKWTVRRKTASVMASQMLQDEDKLVRSAD
jgi:hypothetical protein